MYLPLVRARRSIGVVAVALVPTLSLLSAADCGGSVHDGADGAASTRDADATVRDGADAVASDGAAQCIPDGGQIRLVHPELVEGPCASDCPNGAACVALNRIDERYDGSFCVHTNLCSAVACPACTECKVSGLEGEPRNIGCEPQFGPAPVVSRPELVFGPCERTSDCAAGEMCTDLSAIDPSYTAPRCVRARLTPCEVVWCSTGLACGCSGGIGTACTPAASDPVRLVCKSGF